MNSKEKVNRLYFSAINNNAFLSDIKNADNDYIPDQSDNLEILVFTSIYYGWLVAKYGTSWEKEL